MIEAAQATLGLADAERTLQTTWFSSVGCVYREGDCCLVLVGCSLVGEFGPDDVGLRKLLASSRMTAVSSGGDWVGADLRLHAVQRQQQSDLDHGALPVYAGSAPASSEYRAS